MDGALHYQQVRKALVELYYFITERQFPVVTTRSVFLTTEQIEKIEKFPPPGGLGRFTRRTEMDVTIKEIMLAYEIGGADFEMGFARPAKDVPVIYEAVQEYIRLWVDIILNTYGYKVATISELRALERVSRSLFGVYKYYRQEEEREKYNRNNGAVDDEYGIANIVLGVLENGLHGMGELSFVSYVDQYYEKIATSDSMGMSFVKQGTFIEPQKQMNIVSMFEMPKMQHTLGSWN